jgi:tRNA(Ile)-lysidine synthase
VTTPDPVVAGLLARCHFPPPATPVVCAVSGGPDSTALLVLAVAAGCTVTAVHVDHGLRPGSAAEADLVAHHAASMGAAFRAERVTVGAGGDLEARARAARYAVLPVGVLTGHTADDQAETVLAHLLRGSGRRGLAGMRADDGRVRRPLLALRRSETHELCRHLGLATVDDPSNHDPALTRTRVRAEVLPLLADVARRDPVPVLVRQAALLRDEDDLLDALAQELDPTDARALAAAAPALARRAIRLHLTGIAGGPDAHPPDAAAVERVLAVARGEAVACEIAGGWRVRRSAQRLHWTAPSVGGSRPG